MATNEAAWLDGAGKQLRVAEAPMPKADSDRVVIRNKAIAINPVDWKIQDYGVFVQKWPTVLGCDVAGEVVEVGDAVKHVKKGDRVMGHAGGLATSEPTHGGFALYSSVPAATTTVIPDSISFADASVLPLAIDTAATGLYLPASEGFFGLQYPSLDPSSSDKTIIVWGGSSSVGALTIQLAVASGAKVIATASEHNFDFCKKCGATEVFDYKSSSVVDDVVNAVKSVGGSFAGVYDAISIEDQSFKYVLPMLEKLGGGSLGVVLGPPENFPSSVKVGKIFGMNEVTYPLWSDYLSKAMESGAIKCLPEPMVVGKGLGSVQKGLDENKKGVSAKKVVVEL